MSACNSVVLLAAVALAALLQVSSAQMFPTKSQALQALAANMNFTHDLVNIPPTPDAGQDGSLQVVAGPPGLEVVFLLLEIGPCRMLAPHYHPRGNEFEYTVSGSNVTGWLLPDTTNDGPTAPLGAMVGKPIPPGTVSIYPQGTFHSQVNFGCDRAQIFVSLDASDPGFLIPTLQYFQAPSWMSDTLFTAYGFPFNASAFASVQAYTETLEGQPPAQLTFLPLPAEVCSCPSS